MVLIVLFCAALMTPVRAADAGSSVLCTGYTSCSSKGYSHAGYSSAQHTSYWRMYTGTNCTNYVAYRLVKTNGMPNERPRSGVGNARDWGTTMSSITDATPNVGSVAWWGRTGNHVAYVEKVVSSSEIWVSESNWSGAFDWRRITKSGSGWPDGFIHFADRQIINTAKPEIRGTVKVGSTLTAAGSVWTPKGNTYTYSWKSSGAPIAGASAKTFTPTPAQLGKPLSVSIRATRPSYPSLTATSAAVKVAPGTMQATTPPRITGTAQVDHTLTASSGAWSPSGSSYAYQWSVGGTAVPGAVTPTFVLGPEAVGKQVTVKVTAARSGYAKTAASSAATGAVSPGALASTRTPTISGIARVGSRLVASPGTWSKTGTTYAYQWYVDGTAVSGATGSTFVPRPADHLLTATVHVKAKRSGYAPATAISPQTAKIARGTLTASKAPTITGRARVGSRVTVSTGTWSHAAAISYQWYADGVAIKGATGRSFIATSRERGARLRASVTARADGYTTGTSRSSSTSVVERGRIRILSAPRVTGSTRLGSVLTISPGTHTPAGATKRYRWLRDGKSISGASGRSYRVKTRDLGRKLSVRVTFSAGGYASRAAITKQVGPAKATSAIRVSARPGRRKVAFTIRVTAAGLSAPDGTIRVRSTGGGTHTAKVVNGRVSLALTRQPSGSRTYVFRLSGTSKVTSAELRKSVTID